MQKRTVLDCSGAITSSLKSAKLSHVIVGRRLAAYSLYALLPLVDYQIDDNHSSPRSDNGYTR